MHFCYKKLWKILIDREMKKKELCRLTGISSATLAKLLRGESVTTDTILKICVTLNCGVSDIMDIVSDSDDN